MFAFYMQARLLKRQSSSMDLHATSYGEGKALGLNSAETEPSSTESSTSSASIDESFMNQFLCTGQVDGQIEDVLLGAFGGSDTACKERRGISVDTNGEKYGYYLLHDYYHPSLPELTDHSNIRQKLSLCLLSRQVTPDHVALYVRGHCDVDGDLLKSVGLAIASIADTAETSNSRKLVRLMHQEQLQRLHVREKRNHTRAIGGHSCQRTPRFHSLVECRVCAHTFCSKCLEDHKVVVDTARSKFKLDTLSFCSGCVSAAKYLSAVDVARAAFVLPLS